jgi:hypothetical protein
MTALNKQEKEAKAQGKTPDNQQPTAKEVIEDTRLKQMKALKQMKDAGK